MSEATASQEPSMEEILASIRRIISEDTMARKNAALWTRADLMLTDAFFSLVNGVSSP